ncbi:caspase domain-containing protein [Armillaria borealis]|uniref:Caspase domain-containing protein n=1 Tax=Armillaria borealis TaxID=47425 RepID=A0AA39JMF5_9AGAR|nr:caspase domain-containing protein [Armillaria borealis]
MRMSGDVASRYNGDVLSILGSLHRLRLQYNRAQDNLQAKLEVCPSLPGSRFYAVLIGIDEYAPYPLQGCVSDVRLVERYLTEHLHVPPNRIQLLLGSKEHTSPVDPMNPSRAHIIGALLNIIDNPEILYGDNIVIFYSGHGSSYAFEREGDGVKFIEALCPIDRDTIGDDVKPVPDISDREFNTILTLISRAKGHCITVILDCCYSGSASRGAEARRSSPTMHTSVQGMLRAGEKILEGCSDYRSIVSNE